LITKPITIDHDRWYVQRAGKYWLLYNGDGDGNGDFVQEFKSWNALINFVDSEREKENEK